MLMVSGQRWMTLVAIFGLQGIAACTDDFDLPERQLALFQERFPDANCGQASAQLIHEEYAVGDYRYETRVTANAACMESIKAIAKRGGFLTGTTHGGEEWIKFEPEKGYYEALTFEDGDILWIRDTT